MNIQKSLRLKYQRFTPSGCKGIGSRKFDCGQGLSSFDIRLKKNKKKIKGLSDICVKS